MKKVLYVFLFFMIGASSLDAQVMVSGVVRDANGPLPGVTVAVKEKGVDKDVASTDANGNFSIELKKASNILVFSSVGFQSKELTVNKGEKLEVLLQASSQGLDEVVVVGFGTTKRITNTGSVSSIKASEIRAVPTSSVQNALAGKLPGFFAQQRSGQPGRDASDFFIRGVSSLNSGGNQPLIIVDDIEYTYDQLSQINVNEIESISILKDASTTAIYGIKGANGVLIVTTRRGSLGAPKVNVRLESGMQTPVKKPVFLNSYQTALLVNEALENDGMAPQFSQEDLNHFLTGDDPYVYPYVNWYKEIFKPYSMQYNSNVDISGGDKTVKYFISGGAFTQDGSVRNFSDAGNLVKSNYYYRRFNFRSNLDIQATKSLSMRLDVTGRFNQINSPQAGNIVSEIYDFSKIHPYSAPFLNPNDSYAYASDTKSQLPTINARLGTSGYELQKRNDVNIFLGGTEKLDAITKGLSLSGRIAYASVESITRSQVRDERPPSYLYNPANGIYTLNGSSYTLGNYSLRVGQGLYNSRVNVQAYFNYDRTFGDHHFSSLLAYNQESYKEKTGFSSSNWIPQNFKGFSFRTGYDFQQKYLLDLTAAYNGSDRFQANKRFGLFPAASIGYNISKESFFQQAFNFVDLFKVRASYGIVGSDKVSGGRYLYQQVYNTGGVYSFGETNRSYNTITEGDLGNSNVGWEKQRELDLGVDINLFKSKFSLTVDYFSNLRYDQLITDQSLPLILGIGISPTNIAKVQNRGWDGQLNYHNNIGRFSYNIMGVFSFAKNKIIEMKEPAPTYPWLARTGRPIGQSFGYTFIGFYQDQADIDKSAKPNTANPLVPGDLKYKDLNDDGAVDQYDMSAIGKPNLPNTTFGLTLGGSYKGLSVSVLMQGSTGYSFRIQGTGIEPFQSQFQPIHELRWAPGSGENAKFPRLTANPTTINSPAVYPSDFWMVNATYLRLKTVELGYQLPAWLLPFKMNNIRLYLSGYNLITWTNYSLYQQDPEVSSNSAGDTYLNQRVVNLGIQVGL